MSFATNRRVGSDLEDDFDLEAPVENYYGVYGDYELVGHGEVTNEHCGRFFSFKGCLRVDLHNIVTLDGKNYAGKVFVRKVRKWCCKPSCPVCYKSGWAVREAGNIELRLKEASKRFGQVEHIVCSVPVRDYGLDLKALRHKVVEILKRRGVVGGVLIFHGFRYDKHGYYWRWSPHFHVLGYILGGYRKCRRCPRKWNCLAGCGGFDDRNYQAFLKDGYIVKVLDKRKTVFGTAWYQLNHASIKRNAKRFHVATWFGVCSYRKLKVTKEYRKEVCPICRYELVDIRYCGVHGFVLDASSLLYVRDSFEDFEENGSPAWAERVKRKRVKWGGEGLPVRVYKVYDIDNLFKKK